MSLFRDSASIQLKNAFQHDRTLQMSYIGPAGGWPMVLESFGERFGKGIGIVGANTTSRGLANHLCHITHICRDDWNITGHGLFYHIWRACASDGSSRRLLAFM